jgi:hypothetical protein
MLVHNNALVALDRGLDASTPWPGERRPIAIDIAGNHADVLVFGVDGRGRWSYDIVEAVLEAQDGWRDRGSGGAHGDGWALPWPSEDWTGSPIDVFGTIGRDGLDADDCDFGVIDGEQEGVFVIAVAGLVAPFVARLDITDAAGVRRGEVFGAERAFVRLGIAPLVLGAYDADGHLLEERVVE